jgi:hypothetical protein
MSIHMRFCIHVAKYLSEEKFEQKLLRIMIHMFHAKSTFSVSLTVSETIKQNGCYKCILERSYP